MTTPTSHHLTVTDRDGKQIRGKVTYIQSVAGFFVAHRYRMVDGAYLFEGTFEQAAE